MATQLLVAGIETREEYANVSSAIAKGTCAKQDRNVNHTIINDTSRKRDGPFRSKSSTLITLSNLEFWSKYEFNVSDRFKPRGPELQSVVIYTGLRSTYIMFLSIGLLTIQILKTSRTLFCR